MLPIIKWCHSNECNFEIIQPQLSTIINYILYNLHYISFEEKLMRLRLKGLRVAAFCVHPSSSFCRCRWVSSIAMSTVHLCFCFAAASARDFFFFGSCNNMIWSTSVLFSFCLLQLLYNCLSVSLVCVWRWDLLLF